MTRNLQAELVSTGAELLSGRSINSHARLLGERLRGVGVTLLRDTTIPDDLDAIQQVVQEALGRVDLVFISGGLGPTNDDVTRDAVAGLLGRRVVMDQGILQALRERMQRAGRKLNPARERHALIVEGAKPLRNSAGVAPGERIEHDGKALLLLPGPPAEFQAVLDEQVLPWITAQLGATALRERVLLVCGIAEADIVERFEAAAFPPTGVVTAYCAGAGRVEVRLLPVPDGETTNEQLEQAAEQAATLLGDAVYARERIELEALVGRMLAERKQTLATAESCTGGLIGERLTSVSGSSAYYLGGVITYADEAKIRQLDVSRAHLVHDGAVSEVVAREMAEGVCKRFDAHYGLSVTGIAGPAGGTKEKPVGLVYIAVSHAGGTRVDRHVFPGNRETIREWTCRTALDCLRRCL